MPVKPAIITVMEEAAMKAGRKLLRDFGEVEKLQVSQKGPGDFVSAADRRSEKIIVESLEKSRPDFGFLLEEGGEIKGNDERYRWIVDPLDGTTNFLHNIPFFCISIALEKRLPNGKADIEAALIFAPITNEIFWATKNEGAYLNDSRLLASSRNNMANSTIGTGGLGIGRPERHKTEAAIRDISDHVSAVRLMGSAALELAYVAAGRLESYWHIGLKRWDVAAGILLVREAKGMVTEIGGRSNMLETGSILASNGHMHEKIDSIIYKHYKK